MTAATAPPPVIDALAAFARTIMRDSSVRRRAGALTIAVVLHAAGLWALIVLPPAVMPQVERAAAAISVRLYTVAGGADAETDAPLFEPPLAGGRSVGDTGGDASGSADGDGSASGGPTSQSETQAAPQSSPAEQPAPDPALDSVNEPASPPDPAPQPVEAIPEPSLSPAAPGAQEPSAAAAPAQPPAPARAPTPSAPRDPGAPVATTQPRADTAPSTVPAAPAGPPSFAEIVERARSRLDPDDFRLLANFGNGVSETVRENFCLSSVDANREAFDCPQGANADAARLAQYGLSGLGEEAPEFLEDMDRLAFELATLGADDSTVTRILTALRNERRAVIEAGPLRRQIARDSRPENNNDVPGAP